MLLLASGAASAGAADPVEAQRCEYVRFANGSYEFSSVDPIVSGNEKQESVDFFARQYQTSAFARTRNNTGDFVVQGYVSFWQKRTFYPSGEIKPTLLCLGSMGSSYQQLDGTIRLRLDPTAVFQNRDGGDAGGESPVKITKVVFRGVWNFSSAEPATLSVQRLKNIKTGETPSGEPTYSLVPTGESITKEVPNTDSQIPEIVFEFPEIDDETIAISISAKAGHPVELDCIALYIQYTDAPAASISWNSSIGLEGQIFESGKLQYDSFTIPSANVEDTHKLFSATNGIIKTKNYGSPAVTENEPLFKYFLRGPGGKIVDVNAGADLAEYLNAASDDKNFSPTGFTFEEGEWQLCARLSEFSRYGGELQIPFTVLPNVDNLRINWGPAAEDGTIGVPKEAADPLGNRVRTHKDAILWGYSENAKLYYKVYQVNDTPSDDNPSHRPAETAAAKDSRSASPEIPEGYSLYGPAGVDLTKGNAMDFIVVKNGVASKPKTLRYDLSVETAVEAIDSEISAGEPRLYRIDGRCAMPGEKGLLIEVTPDGKSRKIIRK